MGSSRDRGGGTGEELRELICMKLELSHRRCLSTRKHHAQSKIHPNSIPIYQNSFQFQTSDYYWFHILCVLFIFFSLNADITIYAALSIKWTLQGKTKIIFWLQEGAIAPLRVKVIFISLVSIKLPLTNWNSSCTDLPLTHWWHCKTWKSHIFCHVIYPFSDFVFRFEVILLNEFFEM